MGRAGKKTWFVSNPLTFHCDGVLITLCDLKEMIYSDVKVAAGKLGVDGKGRVKWRGNCFVEEDKTR